MARPFLEEPESTYDQVRYSFKWHLEREETESLAGAFGGSRWEASQQLASGSQEALDFSVDEVCELGHAYSGSLE